MVIDDIVEDFNDDDLEDDFGFEKPKKKDNWQPKDGGGRDNGDEFSGFGDNMDGGKQRNNNLFGGQGARGGRQNNYSAPDDGDTSEEEYRDDARAPGARQRQQQPRGQREGKERQGEPPRDEGVAARGKGSSSSATTNKFASTDMTVEEIRRQVRSSKNTQGLKDGVMKAMPGSTQGKTGWYHTTSDGDVLVAYFHLGNGNWTQISRAIPLDQWEQLLSKPEQERLDKLEANFAMNNMADELFAGGDKGKEQAENSAGGEVEDRRKQVDSDTGDSPKKYELDYASDMKGFLSRALPKAQGILHCYVVRHKSALSPCYTMYLEDGNVFALFGKKMPKNMTLHYRISMEQGMSNKNDDGFLGKLRATKRKTEFCLYDRGLRPKDIKAMESRLPAEARSAIHKQEELCGVTFNAIGYQSSQTKHHMYVTMPEVNDGHHKPWLPDDHITHSGSDTGFTMLDQYANNNENPHSVGLMGLMQKPPVLNRETGRYAQNFHGRVTAASIKNVQLCAQGDPGMCEHTSAWQCNRFLPTRHKTTSQRYHTLPCTYIFLHRPFLSCRARCDIPVRPSWARQIYVRLSVAAVSPPRYVTTALAAYALTALYLRICYSTHSVPMKTWSLTVLGSSLTFSLFPPPSLCSIFDCTHKVPLQVDRNASNLACRRYGMESGDFWLHSALVRPGRVCVVRGAWGVLVVVWAAAGGPCVCSSSKADIIRQKQTGVAKRSRATASTPAPALAQTRTCTHTQDA
jgi:hypothetical protein